MVIVVVCTIVVVVMAVDGIWWMGYSVWLWRWMVVFQVDKYVYKNDVDLWQNEIITPTGHCGN